MHYQGRKMWHTTEGSYTPRQWRERQLAALRAAAKRDPDGAFTVLPADRDEALEEALAAARKLSAKWQKGEPRPVRLRVLETLGALGHLDGVEGWRARIRYRREAEANMTAMLTHALTHYRGRELPPRLPADMPEFPFELTRVKRLSRPSPAPQVESQSPPESGVREKLSQWLTRRLNGSVPPSK